MGVTRQLAEFVSGLRFTDLPQRAADKTKELLLDQIGVQLACSTLPWSKIVYAYIREGGGKKGESTVVNYGLKVIPEDACFVNGAFGHGFENDDLYVKGQLHPGCVVIPAAIALGEREDVSGKDLMLAIAAGYEVASRIGGAVRVSPLWHPTSSIGPFGAAAAACKILHIESPEVARNAIAIASSFCAGLGEFGDTGGTHKRMHAGMASRGGMIAALLARGGLEGPGAAIEGRKGFARAFSPSLYHEDEITAGLGEEFRFVDTAIKIHCCCATVHAAMDAAIKIRREHDVKPEQVAEIVDDTFSLVKPLIGTIVEPEDLSGMQFSAAFSIALSLAKGSAQFGDYSEKNRIDPEILGLARKVKIRVDDEIERRYPESQGAKLTVTLNDGRFFTETVYDPKGTLKNSVSREEIQDKFRVSASIVLPKDRVERIIEAVDGLETLQSIRALSGLFVSDR